MATTLTEMPSSFQAGTTVVYTRTPADYAPSAGWTLTLYIAGVGLVAPVVASGSGGTFTITVPASATVNLPKGNYQWAERVTKAAEVYLYASGTTTVTPNIAEVGAGDMQTWEESTLAIVEAALSGRLTTDMQSYSIAGRSISKIPVSELMEMRSRLASAVAQQRNPASFGTNVLVTFNGTGFDR